MSHTPGPWSIRPNDDDGSYAIISKGRARIAVISGPDAAANAAIMGQAPSLAAEVARLRAANAELAEACKQSYAWGEEMMCDGGPFDEIGLTSWMARTKAALAHAEATP